MKLDTFCDVICEGRIEEVVKEYNDRLKPTTPLEPNRLRAVLLSETEDNTHARQYDPMQIANTGDFALTVVSSAGEHTDLITTSDLRLALRQKKHTPYRNGQWDYKSLSDKDRITSDLSLSAGVAWLFHQAAKRFYKQRIIESGLLIDYKVQPKDTLESIANAQGTTVDTISKYSGISSKAILKIGQPLKYRKAYREWYIEKWGNWTEAAVSYNSNPRVDYRGKNSKNYERIKAADCACQKKKVPPDKPKHGTRSLPKQHRFEHGRWIYEP